MRLSGPALGWMIGAGLACGIAIVLVTGCGSDDNPGEGISDAVSVPPAITAPAITTAAPPASNSGANPSRSSEKPSGKGGGASTPADGSSARGRCPEALTRAQCTALGAGGSKGPPTKASPTQCPPGLTKAQCAAIVERLQD